MRRVFTCSWGASECREIHELVLGGKSAQFFLEGRFQGAQTLHYSDGRHGLLQPDGDERLLDVQGVSIWATPFTYRDEGLRAGKADVQMCDAAFTVRIGSGR